MASEAKSTNYNIVSKSFFKRDSTFERLDAEYAQLPLLKIEDELGKIGCKKIEEISAKYDGDRASDIDPSLNAIDYIAIDDVDTEDGLYYSNSILVEDLPTRAKFFVKRNDVLVSNVRPNRNAVTLITIRSEGSLASSGFTLIRDIDSTYYPPEYLFAFLKTKYAIAQLIRRNRGSMYPAVLNQDVRDIIVPKPPADLKKKVESAVQSGLLLHSKFLANFEKLQEEIEIFLKDVGHPPSPLETYRAGVDWTPITKKDCFGDPGPKRIDAEFHRQEYNDYEKKILKVCKTFRLGDYYDANNGRGLGTGTDQVPYVKQSVLTNHGVNWSALGYEEGSLSDVGRVKNDDILLACTAHEIYYVGRKVDYVRNIPTDIIDTNVAVSDIMIIRPNEKKPKTLHGSYVAAFLRHPAGLHQVQRCIRGLRGGHVYPDDLLKYVLVPIPPDDWLNNFESIAQEAESYRNEAKKKLQEAFSMVEKWISEKMGYDITADEFSSYFSY